MDVKTLLKMTGTSRDSAMLRLTLGRLLHERGDLREAAAHLEAAIAMQADYTAAWKELGKVRRQAADHSGAEAAWTEGIACARRTGDKQAEKEMSVFLRRLQRADKR
jgi:uncharacterized protein HemY